MADVYVSDFPGISKVLAETVFSRPGYHAPKQQTPGLYVSLFVASLISFVLPPFSSLITVVVFPLSLVNYRRLRRHGVFRPGQAFLRAALGLSGLSLAWGFVWFLPIIMFSV